MIPPLELLDEDELELLDEDELDELLELLDELDELLELLDEDELELLDEDELELLDEDELELLDEDELLELLELLDEVSTLPQTVPPEARSVRQHVGSVGGGKSTHCALTPCTYCCGVPTWHCPGKLGTRNPSR